MATIARFMRPERRRLLRALRKTSDFNVGRRLLSVLRFGEGCSHRRVAAQLEMAVSSVVRNVDRYNEEGIEGLLVDRRSDNGSRKVDEEFRGHLLELLLETPQAFGWKRTTWTRELLALQMQDDGFPSVASCTMGRALHSIGASLKSPKPFVSCPWTRARREARIAEIKRLVEGGRRAEPVYYQDEVDIHLNPKIGRDWMLRGHRRWVRTPGQNVKHYLAGALDARTGRLVWVDGEQKASWLFCNLLRRLVALHPRARRIHVIVDNYIIHDSKITRQVLDQELKGRLVLHHLPPYCPDHNRIERVWLDLHSNVTRNHRCGNIDELLHNVFSYLEAYDHRDICNPSLRRAA